MDKFIQRSNILYNQQPQIPNSSFLIYQNEDINNPSPSNILYTPQKQSINETTIKQQQKSKVSMAKYTLAISIYWGYEYFPIHYPSDAYLGDLFFITHSDKYNLFEVNKLASTTVADSALYGNASTLQSEALASSGVLLIQEIPGGPAPYQKTFTDIMFDKEHSKFSFISKIGPSPDWFTGISSLSLLDEYGGWVDYIDHELWTYNSGINYGKGFYHDPKLTRATPREIRFMTGGALFPNYETPSPIGILQLIRTQ